MTARLTIACVKWGRMYSASYANILYDMVKRHLPANYPFTFTCFTDDPTGLVPCIVPRPLPENLKGWWNKLYLFKQGVFAAYERVVYFDLDTLITGSLEPLLQYTGDFAILRDFYRPGGYGSGVMLWRAGAHSHIWESFEAAGRPDIPGGDQAWIEKTCPQLDRLQDLFPEAFAGFKTDCSPLPPKGTRVVCFHGEPKQDNCNAPWVKAIWHIGGAVAVDENALGAKGERARRIAYAGSLPYPWVAAVPPHTREAIIIGNGASLHNALGEIRNQEKQMALFAVGGAAKPLEQAQIHLDAHVLKEEGEAVTVPLIQRYYASTCPPEILATAQKNITLWNPDDPLLAASTAGLNAMRIAYLLGYRKLHLISMDGCILDGRRQSDHERLYEFSIDGQSFTLTPALMEQARAFAPLVQKMVKDGCQIMVYGDGLTQHLSRKLVDN